MRPKQWLNPAGLIAVAQSALGFKWDGDLDSEEGKEAFVRYARLRVKGAMLDELRQMDHLPRAQRRQVKAVQIARERWRSNHDAAPSLADLSAVCGISIDEIARLEHAALLAQSESLSNDDGGPETTGQLHPATPHDEVEARVDTALLMRRLETFFAQLPPRHREVIDAYLGVGLTPVQLASSWKVSPSSVSQLYKAVCSSVARHFGHQDQRVTDGPRPAPAAPFDELVALREAELARAPDAGPWGELVQKALTLPNERFSPGSPPGPMVVDAAARGG